MRPGERMWVLWLGQEGDRAKLEAWEFTGKAWKEGRPWIPNTAEEAIYPPHKVPLFRFDDPIAAGTMWVLWRFFPSNSGLDCLYAPYLIPILMEEAYVPGGIWVIQDELVLRCTAEVLANGSLRQSRSPYGPRQEEN